MPAPYNLSGIDTLDATITQLLADQAVTPGLFTGGKPFTVTGTQLGGAFSIGGLIDKLTEFRNRLLPLKVG